MAEGEGAMEDLVRTEADAPPLGSSDIAAIDDAKASPTRAFWKGHKGIVSLLKRHGLTCQQDKLTAVEYARCLIITQ